MVGPGKPAHAGFMDTETSTQEALETTRIYSAVRTLRRFGLEQVLITRDGSRAYVALGRANHVAVVDVPERKVIDYVLVGKRAWGLALTHDESKLYVANGLSDDITVVVHDGISRAEDDAALSALRDASDWLMRNGLANPVDALAGATPFLRLCGVVTGGWLLARSAQAASRLAADGLGDADFLAQKVVTARFYCDQILPQVHGLVPAVTAGNADLAAARF